MFDSNGQTCNRMCNCEYTYFFYIKIEQAVNPTLSTICMSTVGLCPIAYLHLIVVLLKVLVLRLFLFLLTILSTKLSIASPTVIL